MRPGGRGTGGTVDTGAIEPSRVSVTGEEPGGDSTRPHRSAIERLLHEPWGWRTDVDDVARIPMPDAPLWRRVRYFGVPTLVGFRYGDEHHAVIAVWVRPADSESQTPEGCIRSFERWSVPTAEAFNLRVSDPVEQGQTWQGGEDFVVTRDAKIETLFSHNEYAAAYAGYRAWPGTCTIVGIAFPIRGEGPTARMARDRYAAEGFPRLFAQLDRAPPLQK